MSFLKLTITTCDVDDGDDSKSKASKSTAETRRQVSFVPASNAPATTPPNNHQVAPGNHSTGVVSHHLPPQVTYDHATRTGTGYVRITGGNSSTFWHNYDANVPIADLLSATPNQQATILGAIGIARRGDTGSSVHVPTRSRLTETPNKDDDDDVGSTTTHHSTLLSKALPPVSAPAPMTPLARFIAAAPDPPYTSPYRPPSVALTPVSRALATRASFSSKKSPSQSQAPPAPSVPLKCVSCGTVKRDAADNVERIKPLGNLPLCWKCVIETLGQTGGELYC